MDANQTILLRTRIVFVAVFLFFVAIIVKLCHIQFWQGAYWKKKAEAAGLEYKPLKATRGNIYADDGSLLATSLPLYRVAMDPCLVDEQVLEKQLQALSEQLANFYQDKGAEDYQQIIQAARQAKKRYVVLNKQWINYQAKKQISQWPIFCQGRWQGGVLFEKAEKRFQPFRHLAARTIGFINEDECGAGLEYSFNTDLKGLEGKALYRKTAGGNWKMIYRGLSTPPINGYDLETTLNVDLQDLTHNSLLQALHASEATHGCAVVMKVKTGEIKAMVNLSRTHNGQYAECYNYAAGNQGTIEPGSTFKLLSMLALLEETPIALTDIVHTGDGQYRFYDRVMKDVKEGGYGDITVQEMFENSSNAIARLVQEAFGENPQQFIEYVHKLNFSKPLGLQLAGEGTPFIIAPKSPGWNEVTLPWMSIGYNIKITPLHILTLYNAVANGGKMIQPIIVKKIKQANRTLKTFEGKVLREKICSETTLNKLKILLEGVVEHGPARRFRHGFYKIAGKSGTANKVVDGKYTTDTCISFVGYFPAEKPQYSCIAVVDSPQNHMWHFGVSLATVIKNIADKIAAYDLDAQAFVTEANSSPISNTFPLIRAGNREELSQLCDVLGVPYTPETSKATWVRSKLTDEGNIGWKDNDLIQGRIPHVIGMTLKDALFLLEESGLEVTVQGDKKGRVKTQSPLPGIKSAGNRQISLVMD